MRDYSDPVFGAAFEDEQRIQAGILRRIVEPFQAGCRAEVAR
jgi:hypothetical protein